MNGRANCGRHARPLLPIEVSGRGGSPECGEIRVAGYDCESHIAYWTRRLFDAASDKMLLDFVNGKHLAYLDFEMNLIDVRDAALGHILAAERGRVGERYILGGENLRLSHVLKILQSLTDLPMPCLRIPYVLALGVAAVSELIADTVTHKPPKVSLA